MSKTRNKVEAAAIKRPLAQRRSTPPAAKPVSPMALIGAIVGAVAVTAVLLILINAGVKAATPAPAPPSTSSQTASGSATQAKGFSRGNPQAKVTVNEYADFKCPWCGLFTNSVAPQIMKDYVDAGKVYWVFHNFAFLGQDSLNAAAAAYCAADQNKFWPLEELLYANQGPESQSTFSNNSLKQFAKTAGLDPTAFNSCVDSGKYTQRVVADNNIASTTGVQGTPTFFINGRLYNLNGNDAATMTTGLRKALDTALAN